MLQPLGDVLVGTHPPPAINTEPCELDTGSASSWTVCRALGQPSTGEQVGVFSGRYQMPVTCARVEQIHMDKKPENQTMQPV